MKLDADPETVQDELPSAPLLSERERAVLDLERTWWLLHRSKEQLIREQLDLAPSTYYRLLHDLIGRPDALAYDPLTVRRARRARTARRRARFEGKTVSGPPS